MDGAAATSHLTEPPQLLVSTPKGVGLMGRLLWLMLVVWLAVYVWSFRVMITTDPSGDGFTHGINRLVGFMTWQTVAAGYCRRNLGHGAQPDRQVAGALDKPGAGGAGPAAGSGDHPADRLRPDFQTERRSAADARGNAGHGPD